MNKKLLTLTSLAYISVTSLALPAEPLVVFPQGDFSCTAQVTLHGAAPAPAAADPTQPKQHYAATEKQIDITQIGHIRRDVTTYSDGSVSEFWFLTDQKVGIYQNPGGDANQVFLSRGMVANKTPYLLRFDSDSVSWITKKNLLGSEDGGLHYQVTIEDAGPPPTTTIYQAWITPKTRVPLKFDDGDYVYALTFSKEIPTGPLIMPPAIQAEYNLWLKASTPHPHVQ